MLDPWMVPLTHLAALGCGVVGGVFFAFSTFVLPGLARLSVANGVAAMQSINRTAVRPLFMTALFGTGAVCLTVAVGGVVNWGDEGAALLVAGSVLYLLGNIVVTGVGNVPLNDDLAAVEPDGHGAAERWSGYVRRWSRWNHVRTLTAIASSALLVMAATG